MSQDNPENIPAENAPEQGAQLEKGTYEILRSRLDKHGKDLRQRLDQLNQDRKDVFGAIESTLLATARINTENNCIARDIITIGEHCLFGYNVHMGLRTEVHLKDVFSLYAFRDHGFHQESLEMLDDAKFNEDFANLYRYYKDTVFVKFAVIGPHLFMIFQIGKSVNDIKAFKWLINDDHTLTYVDNRSEHEFRFPAQHAFQWQRAHRDMFREGAHPHISIDDRIFVETIGGDLTIKIEDNTDTGKGIYSEPVDQREQTLDDAEFHYADLGNIILLKIKPYQEKQFRYIAYNEKMQEARRIDAIAEACVLLPDDHGIIFSNGYYLQTGEFKAFETSVRDLHFEKQIASPYGEDFLYVFYNQVDGVYVLLSYNLIEQKVESPIICHGYCLFETGELSYFRAEESPTKHHAIQIWQTPYTGQNFQLEVKEQGMVYKIGNKDIVRAMAECHEILTLLQKDDSYAGLYLDLVKKSGEILDSYYWLQEKETHQLNEPLAGIRDTANSAIDEFEKVQRVKKNTREQVQRVSAEVAELIKQLNRTIFNDINLFVQALADLRRLRGETISLKALRYVDLPAIEKMEEDLTKRNEKLSGQCVEFLLREDSLQPYEKKIDAFRASVDEVEKVADANALEEQLNDGAGELEMLIDIVSNLKIDDATQTTRIIDHISGIYTQYNQVRAELRRKRKELMSVESVAEFNAQVKLVDQAVINYLDLSDTPEKCDEFLTKLMVQIEELEGRFSEYDEFIATLAEKREEFYNAFETRKLNLVEQRNKRAAALSGSAERILKGIRNRVGNLDSVAEINGYFASDLMVDKVRDIIQKLVDLEDNVKADDIQSQLKTVREDAVRQLKDKQELFVDGENIIKFGKHRFSVNVQPLYLTVVPKGEEMYFHLTGTNFFEAIRDQRFLAAKALWDQQLVSENKTVFRGEYLAFLVLNHLWEQGREMIEQARQMTDKELTAEVQKFMAPRFHEGYVKGVHDHDAALILRPLLELKSGIGLLRYAPEARALAHLWWDAFVPEEQKNILHHRLKGIGYILQVFPASREFGDLIADLQEYIASFCQEIGLFEVRWAKAAGEYLFMEVAKNDHFVISAEAGDICRKFEAYLKRKKMRPVFEASVESLSEVPDGRFELVRNWISAFVHQEKITELEEYLDEASVLIFTNTFDPNRVKALSVTSQVTGLLGDHGNIENGTYQLHYTHFEHKLNEFVLEQVPLFEGFAALKKEITEDFRSELRLEEFRPRVMSSFVRNKLIDEVYLHLIGDNLAKQMGVVGEAKRTDLMGMLLLISPPGYGKTTLMEYVANRLGIIFMKINGPAIGHAVTSLDPAEAPNASAREELNKLNLAFEMGDNVMVYLDDIQHLNPEFLQKFISLCDAQRKIEGVYKGKPKTYDLRGKKVCVVMAGNPYTESGEKFRIPDMLANRADTYNLGDILGDSDELFKMSYIENCLTSNPILNKLAGKSQKDVYALMQLAGTGDREGLEFESNHSQEEINEYVAVLKKLFVARDIILRVNLEYIRSAGQSDEYRTEPPFKLQGSYRDMNKIAEKVMPIMNDDELRTLIVSHYENEAQTLTSGAEANLLKFRELNDLLSEKDAKRWAEIKEVFRKQQKIKAAGGDQFAAVISTLSDLGEGVKGISDALKGGE